MSKLYNDIKNNNSNPNTSLLKRLELKKLPLIEESLKEIFGKYYKPHTSLLYRLNENVSLFNSYNGKIKKKMIL